ncbi:FAD:protein FMN transferase [Adhaeribacter rhizoryzae]|uniref:FAD:protein FMN transferase n=2 Tax=Adhaeribacter rhizoryzae TaxID=2607907 RepID=A0A5M6CTN2_9BACT|nr:FAD:protein FMN transferase [Adhaeribacter rhizoryzae]
MLKPSFSLKLSLKLFFCFLCLPILGQSQSLTRFEYNQQHMGTLFRIALYASDSTQAGQAARAAFNRVAELNHILSDYEPNSELNQLCRTAGTGQWVPVSKELWFVLKKSVAVSERTKGAFDVTVGPYVQLWRRARRQGELPTPDALAQARKAVGYQHLKLNNKNKTVQLAVPNMQLDMGAIGKGYAVDEALKILRKHGIKSALIDGGGNIVVSRPPPGTKGWAVSLGITAPTDNTRQLKLLLKHQGVATSGDLYQYLILDGVRYSHILNPFTGLGLTDQSRVTIVARNGLTADWLSTAVSVLGPTDGLALADKTPGAAASFIRQEKDQTPQWLSRRFKKLNTSLLGTE